MVSVAVVNALQDTMSVGESLKWGFTLEELVGCFSRIMVLIKFVFCYPDDFMVPLSLLN